MQVAETLGLQNQTVIKEFILLGFRHLQNIRIILLLVFLIIYIMTIAGNVLIVLLVATDRHLHTPMYFFLGNLSCLESFYSSAILPRMLASFFNGDRSISINGCFVQHYFFAYLAAVECYLLSAMSYDRYVAICKPLHYVSVMNGKLCLHMTAGSWVTGFIASTITIILMSRLVFCGPNEIDHFFCDTYPIMQLSCSNTLLLRILILTFVSLFTLPPFTLTLLSYTYIISTILKIPSTIGKQKAFSTCSSHLIVVTIYYGSITVAYTLPDLNSLGDWNKLISAFYTILIPLINPLIYSLRNKEVKDSLQRSIVIAWVRNQEQLFETTALKNQTYIDEFILLGFGNHQMLKIPFFLAFLLVYIGTMAGNLLIILLIALDQHLHTPMYFFLGSLSCLESCCSSNILPQMLSRFLTGNNMISFKGCFVQHYLFGSFVSVECYMLSAMSYDRYLAICKPLHYVTMMNGRTCFRLIAFSWFNGFLATAVTQFIMSQSALCDNKIDHFFCDTFPIIDLFCGDTHAFKLFLYILSSIFTFPPSILTLTSYAFIILTIVRMPSTKGKQKAFSTCSSHLLVVTIFYGTLMSIYAIPNTIKINGLHKMLSVIYTILTPMLNPVIYTLRNKEVKNAFQRFISVFFLQIYRKIRYANI